MKFGALMACFALLIGAIGTFAFPNDRTVTVGCVISFLAFLVAGGLRLYLIDRFSWLKVDASSLIFVSSLGFRRTFIRQSLAKIVRGSFDVTVRSSFTFSYFLVVGADGNVRLKLPQRWWPDDGINAIARKLNIPITGDFFEVVDGPTFRRQFPKSIPWPVAHPRLSAIAIGVLFLPAVVIVAAVLDFVLGWQL